MPYLVTLGISARVLNLDVVILGYVPADPIVYTLLNSLFG